MHVWTYMLGQCRASFHDSGRLSCMSMPPVFMTRVGFHEHAPKLWPGLYVNNILTDSNQRTISKTSISISWLEDRGASRSPSQSITKPVDGKTSQSVMMPIDPEASRSQQGCGLGLDVSVLRRSRDLSKVLSRSRLGHVGKRLGLVSVSGAKVSVLASVSTV